MTRSNSETPVDPAVNFPKAFGHTARVPTIDHLKTRLSGSFNSRNMFIKLEKKHLIALMA
ncbi:MAG: hypothetical protein H7839_03325 [Magnetococcus sp. YQC-5]